MNGLKSDSALAAPLHTVFTIAGSSSPSSPSIARFWRKKNLAPYFNNEREFSLASDKLDKDSRLCGGFHQISACARRNLI